MRPRRRSSLLNNSTTTTPAVIVATMMIMLSSTSLLSSGGGYCLGRCRRHSSSSSFVVAALRSPSQVHRHVVQRYSRRHRRTAATTTQIAFQLSSSSIVDDNTANVARPSRRTNNDKLKALQSQANQQQLFNIDNDNNNDYERRRLLLQSNSKLALAPMMEYTDRHFRHLIRLLSDRTIVYSEMVAANAISHQTGDRSQQQQHSSDGMGGVLERGGGGGPLRFLQQGHIPEGPSVLQLGGSDVHQLYTAARTVHQYYELQKRQLNEYDSNSCWIHNNNNGNSNIYNDDDGSSGGGIAAAAAAAANGVVLNGKRDELLNKVHANYTSLNLNCGCPSPKVANKGCFGAALMSDPNHVARLTRALHDGARGTMPVSVKCRIGTDDWMVQRGNGGLGYTRDGYTTLRSMKDEYAELCNFIEIVASHGTVTNFQIHARIAVLSKDYSPSENRKVPPLRYEHVRQLTMDYPELQFTLNGGCDTLLDVQRELELCNTLEGVMVGRGFVANPWGFATADELLYPTTTTTTTNNNNVRQRQQQKRPRHRLEILEEYGNHADYEEARYGSSKVRRYILRAITNLFAGEHNSKHYRIALDEIVAASSSRKQRRILRGEEEEENESASSQLLLSELILQAATKHLSEEVLYRTPRESYDRMVYMAEQAEQKKNVITTVMFGGFGTSSSISSGGNNNGDTLVQQWQTSRKEEGRRAIDE